MVTGQRDPKHLDFIDAVRGMAFLAVLALHASFCVGRFPKSSLLGTGGFGVQLFFLASAITLCGSLQTRSTVDRHPILFFYLRRLFRIAPLFWMAMGFYWLVPAVMPSFWLGQYAPSGVKASYFVLTALFLHGWNPYTFNSIVPGGWSIAVEMNFYLIFPLLFYYLNSLRRAAVALLVGILILKVEVHVNPYLRAAFFPGEPDNLFSFFIGLWFPSQIGVFLAGIFTYYLLREPMARSLAHSRFWVTIILLVALVAFPGFARGSGGAGIPGSLLVVACFAAAILAISAGRVPWVVNPVICYIGRLSYSCYLVHFAALGLVLKFLHLHLTAQQPLVETGSPLKNLLYFLAIFAGGLLITIPVSNITLVLIEKPGIALGRRLIGWLQDRSPQRD